MTELFDDLPPATAAANADARAKAPRRYGLPYLGSKNKIAAEIVDFLPAAEHFYDLFAGGCAITHAALLSGKFQVVHANDRRGDIVQLFADCAAGRRPTSEDWRAVTREEFFASRDPLIRQVWSFGNNGKNYLWNDDTAGMKLLAHRMIVSEDRRERLKYYRQFIKYLQRARAELDRRRPECIQSLQSLERLQSLQSLERLQSLETTAGDYQDVAIEPGATVYADPPYRKCKNAATKDRFYGGFDFDRFDAWLRAVPFPVYISEYVMPEDFVCVWRRDKTCSLGGGNSTPTVEKIFIHERWRPQKLFTEPELFT